MKQRPVFPARLHQTSAAASSGARARVAAAPSDGASLRSGRMALRVDVVPVSSGRATIGAVAARRNMVQKLVAQGLADRLVASAMEAVERHNFVDSALEAQAYEDTSLPIGLGQTISKPGVVARMITLLRNGRPERLGRVLEIGTGCGYQAAVLSLVATEVYSIERLRQLHEKARANLRPMRLATLHLLFGDGMAGFAKGAPYAGIIAAAGGENVPAAWTDQLAVGGRLVAPVAQQRSGGQALVVIDRTPAGLQQTICEAVHFVPLKSGVA